MAQLSFLGLRDRIPVCDPNHFCIATIGPWRTHDRQSSLHARVDAVGHRAVDQPGRTENISVSQGERAEQQGRKEMKSSSGCSPRIVIFSVARNAHSLVIKKLMIFSRKVSPMIYPSFVRQSASLAVARLTAFSVQPRVKGRITSRISFPIQVSRTCLRKRFRSCLDACGFQAIRNPVARHPDLLRDLPLCQAFSVKTNNCCSWNPAPPMTI